MANIDEMRRLIFLVIERTLELAQYGIFEVVKTLRTSTLVYNLIGREDLLDVEASRLRKVLKDIAIRALDIPDGDRGVTPLGKLGYITLFGQATGTKVSLNQASWISLINDELEVEFEDFVDRNQESPKDAQTRENFLTLIESFMRNALNVKCLPYGSRVTGLTLKDSDLDLGIRCPDYLMAHGGETAYQSSSKWRELGERSIATKLATYAYDKIVPSREFIESRCTADLRATARKPLIRFVDSRGLLSADVVFGFELAGCRNSTLLAHYNRLDPRVRPLVIFIKYWSKQRIINGSFIGFLSSFGHTLTVIEFLQRIEPPVLPNIQIPTSILSNEELSQDPNYLHKRNLPWHGWTSKNEMTLGQLLRAYFAYMTFECPWVSNIISPRCAPEIMTKKFTFLENSQLNSNTTLTRKPNNTYDWIYLNPEHSLRECVQDRNNNLVATFSRLCVEDPSEKERLLLPHRQYAQDQTTYEHLRAFLLLESGRKLSELCQRIVPLSEDPSGNNFIDINKLRVTKWWTENNSSANEDDIVSRIRAQCVEPAVQKLRSCDLLAPPDIELFPPDDQNESIIDHWRKCNVSQRLARYLSEAEEDYIVRNLTPAG